MLRLRYRGVRKLWLVYLFLLFFSFFMFAISISVYLQSINKSELHRREYEAHKSEHRRDRGAKQVVAHYVGSGNLLSNMTKDDYNRNNFAPVASAGVNGKPVVISPRESLVMQRMFQIHKFNILASDRIPLNRTIPDYRNEKCVKKTYDNNLPSTSVIIVFHNEAWSVLLRTVWSVINRSPRYVLEEILLIDDASDRNFLRDELDRYVAELPVPTRVLRMPERKGLVPARLLGARQAKGKVLTFLDAHCECSPGWLEPLLVRIKNSRHSVVSPVIDIISDDNFGYTKTFELHWGAFNWQLNFRWFVLSAAQVSEREMQISEPFKTPAFAGGLFSIDRDYFFEIGAYDENMKIWGGENVEMSFRIWQCGGSLEISPCSHVGHVFRKTSPYTFPGGLSEVLSENLARAALVWMDEWTDFVFMYNPMNSTFKKSLDVSDRIALRNRLNCKPFSWYLRNIWPNNFFPTNDRLLSKMVLLDGQTDLTEAFRKAYIDIPRVRTEEEDESWPSLFKRIKRENFSKKLSLDNDTCLKSEDDGLVKKTGNSLATIGGCQPTANLQDMFVITPSGEIMTNDGVCLDAIEQTFNNKKMSPVRLVQCSGSKRQLWSYDLNTFQIHHTASRKCLAAEGKRTSVKRGSKLSDCNTVDKSQRWGIISLPWK